MPELPEVETVKRQIQKSGVLLQKIVSLQIFWNKTVGNEPSVFFQQLINKKIVGVRRRGKYLIFFIEDNTYLVAHLRMSGQFLVKNSFEIKKHDRVIFGFENGLFLHFHDPRKFGRIVIVKDPDQFLSHLGIEPLAKEFTFEKFSTLIYSDRSIKALLLDQSLICGLGNIYVDEALWSAMIHPLTRGRLIAKDKLYSLHKAIIQVLQRGLEYNGTSLGKGASNFHNVNGNVGDHQEVLDVYSRTGLPCKRCGALIEKTTVASRGTHFCPNCQISS